MVEECRIDIGLHKDLIKKVSSENTWNNSKLCNGQRARAKVKTDIRLQEHI